MIYLSLGAGVQSTALYCMTTYELYKCPRAEVAIFADTGDEPAFVYDALERLRAWGERYGGPPIETVAKGHLSQDALDRQAGKRTRFASLPVFTMGKDGRAAPLRRQCTKEYKIVPIEKRVRELLGYKPRQRVKAEHNSVCLLGISMDEAVRITESRTRWITNKYPLIDAFMTRLNCMKLIEDAELPVPEKSACVFCPYHSNSYWRELKKKYPEEWARAVAFDAGVRNMSKQGARSPVFIHRSLVPLDEVDLGEDQTDLFGEECAGYCGV